MKSSTAHLKPLSRLFIFDFGLVFYASKKLWVEEWVEWEFILWLAVDCFISQVFRNKFWTCCMANYIRQPFWDWSRLVSPFSFKFQRKITDIWQCKTLWPNAAAASVCGRGWRENFCISWYKDALNIQASAYIVSLTCKLQTLNILSAYNLASAK